MRIIASILLLLCALTAQAQTPVTFVWNAVTNATGYKLYWGATNSTVFTHSAYLPGRENTNVTIVDLTLPARVAATSVDLYGAESDFSAEIRVVNQELVRVFARTASAANAKDWKDAGTVYLGPPQGSGFWRLDVQRTNQPVQAP